MATYHQLTTSNNVEVSDIDGVQSVIDRYDFLGDFSPLYLELTPATEDSENGEPVAGTIAIHGQAPFHPHPPVDDLDEPDDRYEDLRCREFLEALLPYLEDDLVIQTIGHTKTRFPFSAHEWVATPDGRVHHTTFTHGTLPDPDTTTTTDSSPTSGGEPA